jgi:hypothetical protein
VGKVVNYGVGGSTLQGLLLRILQVVPRDSTKQLSIIMYGANDLAVFGPSLGGFESSLRLLVSRLRSQPADVHTFTDSALSYSGPWSAAFGERVTTSTSSFTWRSPPGFSGGVVAFTASLSQGHGARYAFTLDGRAAGVWDTRRLPAPSPAPAVSFPGAFRLVVPPGAGHVVRCDLSGILGAADLVGWQLEASKRPLVVLVEQPRMFSYGEYRTLGVPFIPSDSTVRALNRAIDAVASTFDSYVITANPDRLLGKKAAYYQRDGVHPNAAGQRLIAIAVERAIDRSPHVRSAPSR